MPRRRQFIRLSIISATLCVVAVVVLMLANSERLVRWNMIGKLCSDDPAQRQRGINYVIQQIAPPESSSGANDDSGDGAAATRAAVRDVLAEADDACFDQIVAALSSVGQWGPDWGEAWVRYLTQRAPSVSDAQQSQIAVELGKTIRHRRPHPDDARTPPAIAQRLADDNADVRLNALSAAAILPERDTVRELLLIAAGDEVEAIAERAARMLALLEGRELFAGPPPAPPADAIQEVRRLAELEAMPTASADLPITDDLSYLLRLQTVRVSTQAMPEDLLPLFGSDQPAMHDLAAIIATDRFDPPQVTALALSMLRSFDPELHKSGAILAGLAPRDEQLISILRQRAASATDWIAEQHFHLGLLMQGEEVEGFDPVALLAHDQMPRTTVLLALLHMGRLEGLDWLLNPFGEPPASLPMLLDQMRYWIVLRRYLPPELTSRRGGLAIDFWLWADRDVQRRQTEALRDWYLMHRARLKFDPQRRIFTLSDQDVASKTIEGLITGGAQVGKGPARRF